MKSVSTLVQAALDDPTAHFISLVTIHHPRTRELLLAMTDHAEPIRVGGILHRNDIPYVWGSVKLFAGLETGDISIQGRVIDPVVAVPLRNGLLDGADIAVHLWPVGVRTAATDRGIPLIASSVGAITLGTNGEFEIEIRSAIRKLSQSIGAIYQPECRADLGDERCLVDLAPFTRDGVVSAVTTGREFTEFTAALPADDRITDNLWYAYGTVEFRSGENIGVVKEVKRGDNQFIFLRLPTPRPIAIGDRFRIVAGCDKRLATCRAKYSNAGRFQGEPYLPGNDRALDYQTDVLVG